MQQQTEMVLQGSVDMVFECGAVLMCYQSDRVEPTFKSRCFCLFWLLLLSFLWSVPLYGTVDCLMTQVMKSPSAFPVLWCHSSTVTVPQTEHFMQKYFTVNKLWLIKWTVFLFKYFRLLLWCVSLSRHTKNEGDILTVSSNFHEVHQRFWMQCGVASKTLHSKPFLHWENFCHRNGGVLLIFLLKLAMSCGKEQV